MVTKGENIPEYIEQYDYYKNTDKKKSMMIGLRDFHNLLVLYIDRYQYNAIYRIIHPVLCCNCVIADHCRVDTVQSKQTEC